MPTVRQTTTQGGKTVLVREFQTNPPPSTGEKRKEVNTTALLAAQPSRKTPKPSSANQPNLKTLVEAIEFEGDVRDFMKNAGGENLAPDEAVAEKSKGVEAVEEKEKPECCFRDNCSKEATIWPFKNDQRASRRLLGYCKKCDVARRKAQSSNKREGRRIMSVNNARKVLYGWAQEAPICFQECNDMPGYTKDQAKLGFFSRDFLKEFVTAARMMVGKESTVASAKASEKWKAIAFTQQQGQKYSGMYHLARDELGKTWQTNVGKMMGLSCDQNTNPHVYTFSYFVASLKEELGLTGTNDIGYQVKIGLVATVTDYVQMPHQDCGCLNDMHSWIFHVPINENGSYIYIWDVTNPLALKKTLVHIPLGSFLVLREDVWHSGIVGGEGNVRVHGGIFEPYAFGTSSQLVYPPVSKDIIHNLKAYKRGFDAVHNKDPIDYENAVTMVSPKQAEQLKQMFLNLRNSFPVSTLFYAPLPPGDHDA